MFYPHVNPISGYPIHQPTLPFQSPQVKYLPPAPQQDPIATLSDSVLALALQEEERKLFHRAQEEAQRQTTEDEFLAKQLQESESTRERETQEQEIKDKKLALQLLKETERLVTEQAKRDQLRKDSDLAQKMFEEEKMKAITLDAHEKFSMPKPLTAFPHQHALEVHNNWCPCKKVSAPTDNNHIFKTHDRFCRCGKKYITKTSAPSNNQGIKHKHNEFCCLLAHAHNNSCFCSYEAHQHTFHCCPYDHVHSRLCHCTHK